MRNLALYWMEEYKIVKYFKCGNSNGYYICSNGSDIKVYLGTKLDISELKYIEYYKYFWDRQIKLGIIGGYTKYHKEILDFISVYQRELKFSKLDRDLS